MCGQKKANWPPAQWIHSAAKIVTPNPNSCLRITHTTVFYVALTVFYVALTASYAALTVPYEALTVLYVVLTV